MHHAWKGSTCPAVRRTKSTSCRHCPAIIAPYLETWAARVLGRTYSSEHSTICIARSSMIPVLPTPCAQATKAIYLHLDHADCASTVIAQAECEGEGISTRPETILVRSEKKSSRRMRRHLRPSRSNPTRSDGTGVSNPP